MAAYKNLRAVYGSSAVAAIDAGVTCVKGQKQRTYTVVDAWVRAHGTASGTTTSVDISDTSNTIKAVVFTRAGLSNHATLRAGTATTGVATNLGKPLTAEEGIMIKTVGAALATTTDIEWCVLYTVTPTVATV